MSLPSSSTRYRLWVDGCGGFLLVLGDQTRIGRGEVPLPIHRGPTAEHRDNEVAIVADLPRHAGSIHRRGEDYFWVTDDSDTWIGNGQAVPISGSAKLTLTRPSSLTPTAMLSLAAPHRFLGHVDQVALVSDVLLIGNTADCHIQSPQFATTTLLRHHHSLKKSVSGQSLSWQMREKAGSSAWMEVPEGESFAIEDVSIMLETL